MPTDNPNIVVAYAPRYTRRKRKGAAVPTRVVVDHGQFEGMSEDERGSRSAVAGSSGRWRSSAGRSDT